MRVRDCCSSIPTITVSRSFSFCPQSGGDGDLLIVFRPGGYCVARRNPAADTLPFKGRHDSDRWGPVRGRVTQKNVVSHLLSEAQERGMFSVVTRSPADLAPRSNARQASGGGATQSPRTSRAGAAENELLQVAEKGTADRSAGWSRLLRAPQQARPQTRELDARRPSHRAR